MTFFEKFCFDYKAKRYKIKNFYIVYGIGFFYFRLFGYGLHFMDYSLHIELYSREEKIVKIGRFTVKLLRP